MGSQGFLWVLTCPYWFVWVLTFPFASLRILMGPYGFFKSLFVTMESNKSLCVFIVPYAFL